MAKIEWGKLVNPLLSFFDKEFRSWAEKGAKKIPQNSVLRKKEGVERGFDILRGFLEKNVQFDNVAAQAIKEKIIDIGDYFASSLFGREKADKKAMAAAEDWMERFLAYAEKHLGQAKTLKDLEGEAKRLEREFAIRKKIVEIVEAAAKAAEPEKPPEAVEIKIDWEEKFKSLKKRWKRKWKPRLEKLDDSTASSIRGIRKSLDWLMPRKIR